MEFSKKQYDFLINSNARYNIADGAVRSGKTFIFNIRWLDYIKNGPSGDLVMVGKTLRTLEQNVLTAKMGLFELLGAGNYKYNRSTGELFIGDRKIYCKGASDESAENKIRGMTLAGALCDEVTLYPQNFIEQLKARCSVAGAKQFWNCNPDSPFHYIYTDYITNQELLDNNIVKTWHFLMDDNPILDKSYVNDLKSTYSGIYYKRWIEGLWVIAEGLIYDMFSEKNIIKESDLPSKFDKYYLGVDYGTQNPCVFLLIGQKGDNSYILKEYYYDGRESKKQKTDAEYAKDMKKFIEGYNISKIAIDPSAASFIAALKSEGIYPTKAKNDVLDGIRNVSTLIASEKLFVCEKCKNTIEEFYTYAWDEKSAVRGEDKPLKTSDHAMDALRYYCNTFLYKKSIKTLDRSLLSL